ncbi:MAG: fumarylacetoacetate hydrolase family protein [Pseudomonadota bacterium]
MNYALPLWPQPSLPIVGSSARFPVRRIFCVGRNYAEHIREMGGDPDREAPFFFMKPADSLAQDGAQVPYPPGTSDLHHEVELVLAIGGGGRDIAPEDAAGQLFGQAVGIDLTRRDLQGEAKKTRRPWEVGKAFEQAAPCGPITPIEQVALLERGAIRLRVGDQTRQAGDLGQMIWSSPEIVSHLSRLFTLKPGDLIFTGTPDGVGPVGPGERLRAEVEGLAPLIVEIT